VLIANDEPYTLICLENALLNKEYISKVDKASNGLEALELIKKNEIIVDSSVLSSNADLSYYYDLILLDINMPPFINGYDTCIKIK